MIPKLFPTVNNVAAHKQKTQTLYTELLFTDTPNTVKHWGPKTYYFTFATYDSTYRDLDTGEAEWVGTTPEIRFFYGQNFPPEISEKVYDKNQFAILYSGYLVPTDTNATIYFSGEGQVYGVVITRANSHFPADDTLQRIDTSSVKSWGLSGLVAGERHLMYLYYMSPAKSDQMNNVLSVTYKDSTLEKPIPLTASKYNHISEVTAEPATMQVQYYSDVELSQEKNVTSKLSFKVPIVSSTASLGYVYDKTNHYLYDVQDSSKKIKRFRMIEFFAGYQVGSTISTVTKFTGQVRDWKIVRGKTKSHAEISCYDWSSFLSDTINEGHPNVCDYLTFHLYTNGYVAGHTKPQTFDAWRLEDAVECLLLNAHIDPEVYRGKKKYLTVDDTVTEGYYLNSEINRSNKVSLDRNINYGDPLKLNKEDSDEEYFWQFSIGDSLYDNIKELTDNYGFSIGFNNEGKFYCKSVLNPIKDKSVDKFELAGTWSTLYDPKYLYAKSAFSDTLDSTVTATFVGVSSALVLNRGTFGTVHIWLSNPTLGLITTASFNPYRETSWAYYDGVDGSLGYNPAVLKVGNDLKYGSYSLNMRLTGRDGVSVNALFIYDEDHNYPSDTFYTGDSTENSILLDNVEIDTSGSDFRNDVVVVGKLLGIHSALTLDDTEQAINPNNPVSNHIVSRAIDKYSLSSLSYPTYVGRKLQTIIVEPKIGTQDRADWLAYETILRYNSYSKLLSPRLQTTGHPLLELGDYVKINDDYLSSFGTISDFWVTQIQDKYGKTSYTTEIELSGLKPWNSFYKLPTPSPKEFGYSPFYNVRVYNVGLPALDNEWVEVDSSSTSSNLVVKFISQTSDADKYTTQRITDFVPEVGYVQVHDEIIKYTGFTVSTMTKVSGNVAFCTIHLTGLTRGMYATSTLEDGFDDYIGTRVYMDYSPYLSEEEGLIPMLEFDLLYPGAVRVSVTNRNATPVEVLTSPSSSDNPNEGWKQLELGRHRFSWGALDRLGAHNSSHSGRWSWTDSIGKTGYIRLKKLRQDGTEIVTDTTDVLDTLQNWKIYPIKSPVFDSYSIDPADWRPYFGSSSYTQLRYTVGKDFYAHNLSQIRYGSFGFNVQYKNYEGLFGGTSRLTKDIQPIYTRLYHGREDNFTFSAESSINVSSLSTLWWNQPQGEHVVNAEDSRLSARRFYTGEEYDGVGYGLKFIFANKYPSRRIVNVLVTRYIIIMCNNSPIGISDRDSVVLAGGRVLEEAIGDSGFTTSVDNSEFTIYTGLPKVEFITDDVAKHIEQGNRGYVSHVHLFKVVVTDMSGRQQTYYKSVYWLPVSYLNTREMWANGEQQKSYNDVFEIYGVTNLGNWVYHNNPSNNVRERLLVPTYLPIEVGDADVGPIVQRVNGQPVVYAAKLYGVRVK